MPIDDFVHMMEASIAYSPQRLPADGGRSSGHVPFLSEAD